MTNPVNAEGCGCVGLPHVPECPEYRRLLWEAVKRVGRIRGR